MVCLVAVGLIAAAGGPSVAETNGGVRIPSFYDPPAKLPSVNGTLIRQEPVHLVLGLELPGISLPAKATRIMYRSTDSTGTPVAVSGIYLEPSVKWTRTSQRPLVTYSEGTQGMGDQCAPSYVATHPLIVTSETLHADIETPSIYGLLARGIAVVVTDYIGLGTTGRLHTYLNRVDIGRAVLDAARAAPQVVGATVTTSSRVSTYGYSEGGAASGAALELQPSYAPDVNLVAGYVGAPPANMTHLLKTADGTIVTGIIGWFLIGQAQDSPRIQAILDTNLNATGRSAFAALTQQCTIDAIIRYGLRKTSAWTKSGESLNAMIARYPVLKRTVGDQDLGTIGPHVPVRLASGTEDDIVPHADVEKLASQWCNLGANLTYRSIPQLVPTFGLGIQHILPHPIDMLPAQAWVSDRLAGQSATNTCAKVPSQK